MSASYSTAKTQTIELILMGQKIVLRTSADPKHVEAVTALVKERLAVSEKRLKGSNAPHLAAVLALFDLSEEYIEAKKRTADHLASVEDQSRKLSDWVQAEISAE